MKRLFLFLTIFSLGFSLIACDSDSEEETSENIDISGVTFLDEEFEYTGEPFSISCKNIPTGVLVTYEGNSVSEVGTHTVVAILKDSKGNELGRLEATITILAAGNNEQTTPVHNHNVCPECGKCLDPECEGEKCLGHESDTPVHEHEVCLECGKCLDPNCEGEKCLGHEDKTPVHEHNACPECGKCLDPNCEGEKCLGHKEPTPTPSERAIEVDYENVVVYAPSERSIRVAQFADAHFGVDNRDWHNDKMDRTKEYMAYVVETSKPDLIVCSGDNVIGTGIVNNAAGTHDLEEFVEFVDSFGIPWTFMYGNHDAETQSKKAYSDYLLECIATGKTKYLFYKEDYVEVVNTNLSSSDEGRYGNFVLPVYDLDDKTKLMGAYIFFDAGTYLYDKGEYQTITSGQVAWYEQVIADLQATYTGEGVVPTIAFTHIQLPEHEIAYHEAYYNQTEGYEFVVRQDEMAGDFKNVTSQDPATDSGLFDKMVELGSTRAVFVGHAHEYYFQVKSHGIVLGYGPQCGFSKLFELNDEPRLTYVYNVDANFDFTTTGVKEVEDLGEGLTVKYFDGTNGDSRHYATFDEATGLFTVEVTCLKQWARIKLYYNGEVISTADSNYTFTGDYQAVCDTNSLKLYPGSDPANLFYPNTQESKYTITFDPETKTVTVTAPPLKAVEAEKLYIEYTYGSANENRTANILEADADGNYLFQVELATWRAAKLYFDGELITSGNTKIEGLYAGDNSSADWTMNLYWAENNRLMTCTGGTYIFVYNPTTKVLKIGSTGLLYNVNKKADYDSSSKTYSFVLKPSEGDKLTLDFDAIGITSSNVTVTGAFSTANSDVTGNVFYQLDANTNEFYAAAAGTYIITYNPATNTLDFQHQVQSGLTITTRYDGTTSATPVDTKVEANPDGTYTIEIEFQNAWGYIYFTYNGIQLSTSTATYPSSYPPGIYYENGGIYCNNNAEALCAYIITFDPATSTITMVKK